MQRHCPSMSSTRLVRLRHGRTSLARKCSTMQVLVCQLHAFDVVLLLDKLLAILHQKALGHVWFRQAHLLCARLAKCRAQILNSHLHQSTVSLTSKQHRIAHENSTAQHVVSARAAHIYTCLVQADGALRKACAVCPAGVRCSTLAEQHSIRLHSRSIAGMRTHLAGETTDKVIVDPSP